MRLFDESAVGSRVGDATVAGWREGGGSHSDFEGGSVEFMATFKLGHGIGKLI